MTDERDPRIIYASPTKALFIHMLVKDIPLIRAIIDLVDNCVDGARRLRPDGDYNGLWVRLEIAEDHLRIADNCGGIPIELARHYAFRFGRPEDMEPTPHSVGQFGVGMKRAFFKLGNKFRVESVTATSRFVVEEDVNEWKEKDEWEFTFDELEEDLQEVLPEQQGSTIAITSLHKSVSDSFKLETFQIRLTNELGTAHLLNMNKGLAISLNGIPLQVRPLMLLQSDRLKPAYQEMAIEEVEDERGELSPSPVNVKIYAGLSESKPVDAGWYVFCNGRMLLEHDQTLTTGWGEGGEETIPKYHNQYAMFRGYMFFDSDDAGLLPWNTTKTGVDADSPVFQAVRLEMIKLMRPVIDFLNRLKDEKARAEEEKADDTPLEAAVRAAEAMQYSEVSGSDRFSAPKPKPQPRPPSVNRILYYKPVDEVNRAKKVLGVRTLKQVGERTFEYFLKMECED